MMINQNKVKKMISAYLDDQLSEQEKQTVERYIEKDCSLKRYFQQMKSLRVALKEWSNEDLSPDLEQKIKSQLSQVKLKEGVEMRTQKRWIAVGVGGSVAVTILMVVLVGQLYMRKGPQGQLRVSPDDIGRQQPLVTSHKKKERFLVARDASSDGYQPRYLEWSSDSTHACTAQAVDFTGTLPIMPQGYMGYQQLEGIRQSDGVVRISNLLGVGDYLNQEFNTEQYDRIYENDYLEVKENPLSTFSIDVDTASYANVRRFLNSGQMPPKDAVRIEEMINYFSYDYPQPQGGLPFSVTTEVASCPWNEKHDLVMIGLQGKNLDLEEIPPSNLVFLLDVSGSMNSPQKLPLLKKSFRLLVKQLRPQDKVAIVVYAGAAGEVLKSTPGSQKSTILDAIDRLNAGGSTAGGDGIKLAYKIAVENFIPNGNNRVILATDGDFNVGVSSDGELIRIIEEKRKKGVFLTILGFGTGNYKDSKMEKIADKGNGNYAYIDDILEAKKVLVNELGATLFTIAKDVKIQIEFNPAQVKAYRLIGYENRMLKKEDFNDDKKDAGELGAGHSVTAFYEIVPAGSDEEFSKVDSLQYQKTTVVRSADLMTVKLRYKEPEQDTSKLIIHKLTGEDKEKELSGNFRFASAVAEFGLILRDSQYKQKASFDHVLNAAMQAIGEDREGYRFEFINLVKKAQLLDESTK